MSPARKPQAGHESWDAFWAETSAGRTEVIRGVEVPVPTDMPIVMERRVEELRESESEEDLRELVGLLFGRDILGEWMDQGMGVRELQTVLTWGYAQANGRDITFREALEIVQSGGVGKQAGPNRATRRASAAKKSASVKASAAGGGRSRRTSSGSTGSARTRSRA